jgi:sugar lactone lactonase YvrE
VYILDTGNWQIEKYTLQGKRVGILRPPGLVKLPAEASGEADLTVDGDGNVYAMVSTDSTLAIEKLRSDGKEIGRWTSVGPHRAVSFGVDSLRFAGTVGYLSVTDGRVLKVDQRMHVLTSWTVQQLRRPLFHSHPVAIAAGSAGQVYVADGATREVIGLSSRSGLVARWKTLMLRPSGPLAPSLAVEPGGDVVVADADGTRIETYSPDGKLVRRSGVAANSGSSIRAYTGLGIDGNSNLSVLTYPQGEVETFSSSGRLLHSWCPGCNIPGAAGVLAMIVSRTGKVYVAAGSMVVEFTPVGVPVHSWNGQTITGSGPVIDVAGIAVDSQGNLYVSDLDNNALEVFSPSGRRRAFWTSLSPNGPALSDLGPVAVDGQGNIFLVNGKSVLELAPLRAHE